MSETIQMRDRGVFTLPASVRDRHGIQAGDSFRLVDLDGILVLAHDDHGARAGPRD